MGGRRKGGGAIDCIFVVSLPVLLSRSPFCCLPVHSVVSLSILLSCSPFCCLALHSVVSLSILLSCSPFCCLALQSVVSLSILLPPCSFCHLALYSIFSLFILLSYRETAKTKGGILTKAVNVQSVVFIGILVHGQHYWFLFNKVCWICPSDIRSENNHWANV